MIELADVPELRDPIMIAAFEGWNDAGEAATAAIEHGDGDFLALDILEVVVRELRPFLLQLAFGDVPVAFDFECVHNVFFVVD